VEINNHNKALIEKFLINVPVFRSFTKKHLRQIIRDFRIKHAEKGETIFFQEDKSTELYIILKGRTKVTLLSEEGKEFILTELKQGNFFGELSLIDGNPRSASVIAEEESTFGVLRREHFLLAIKKDPSIAVDMLKTLVQMLRRATEREERFVFLDIRNRLVRFMHQLTKIEGARVENGFYRIKKRTHKELAARTGASREAISKVLKDMIIKKAIIEEKRYFLINPGVFESISISIQEYI
jgi:CRP/FNR family transcriptional regulator/CRP/FNR family cyclic AMP-dependent transcriptional regulator